MEQNPFFLELKQLTSNEDVLAVSKEINELKVRFEDFILEEERKAQIALMDAAEKGEEIIENDWIAPLKKAFFEVYKEYKSLRQEIIDKKNEEENSNLRRKNALIQKMLDTIQNEENIGAAFGAYKNIHEEWKTIGNVPREKREEIQKKYSKLIEDFFYQMKIFKEIKDHDLKRNQQLKLALIEKLEELKNNPDIKDLEANFKTLQEEWDEIGPVANETWEEIKGQYWEKVKHIQEKVNQFYQEKRHSMMENLEKKKAILEKAKNILEEARNYTEAKDIDHSTKKLIDLQEEWKSIGFGPRKENEEIWKEFRAICDAFFAIKKTIYDQVKSTYDLIAEKKKEIIQKAHELKDSEEWKNTSEHLKKLQKKWKDLGHAGHKYEQKLWKEFREACDHFFDKRSQHLFKLEGDFEENLNAKLALIEEIKNYQLKADKKESIEDLKQFAQKFNAIGMVAMKDKDNVYQNYKKALDALYESLKLEGEEKDRVFFQAKLDTIAASNDAFRLYQAEKQDIRKQIDKLNGDILQYENNLGFFAKSKGADTLKKEVEGKINFAKSKIQALKNRLKMIPNE